MNNSIETYNDSIKSEIPPRKLIYDLRLIPNTRFFEFDGSNH